MKQHHHIPEIEDQKAKLNEFRDLSKKSNSGLDSWLAFRQAVINYYQPYINLAERCSALEKELETYKKEVENLKQLGMFAETPKNNPT